MIQFAKLTPELQAIAYTECKDHHASEDVVQDTYVKVFEEGIISESEIKDLCRKLAKKKYKELTGFEIPLATFQKYDNQEYIAESVINRVSTPSEVLSWKEEKSASTRDFRLARSVNSNVKNFLPFETARIIVRDLRLRNQKEWLKYAKTDRPSNIPANPQTYYKGKGWINFKDWIGSSFLSYEEAKSFIQANYGPLTKPQFCKMTGILPITIPRCPQVFYKDNGWAGWPDFLDPTHELCRKRVEFVPYEEAKRLVREKLIPLGIDSITKFKKCDPSLIPLEIPRDPFDYYRRTKEWISIPDFFGTSNKASTDHPEFMSFKEAKEWCRWNLRANGINNYRKYRAFVKGKYDPIIKPASLPSIPNRYYKKWWTGWGDYLGTGSEPNKKTRWPYEKARQWVRRNVKPYGIDSYKKWRSYVKGEIKIEGLIELHGRIPHDPAGYYKSNGWVDWDHWLLNDKEEFLPYHKARAWVHKHLKPYYFSSEDWRLYKKGEHRLQHLLPVLPKNIPKTPGQVYKGKGWKGFVDFIGTRKTGYLKFEDAKQWYIENLSKTIKNLPQWQAYVRGKYPHLPPLPYNVPKEPNVTYLNKGYTSANDWFVN